MIYVTNIKRMPKAEYIGRFNPSINRESPLHNPFRLQKHEAKGSTLGRYERYLNEKIAERDPVIMKELNRLLDIARQGDLYLGCWCSPQPCHGDIIRAKLLNMLEEQTMNKRVAIIGSRDLNEEQLQHITSIAEEFVRAGYEVSTGCADGADYAAMVGARNVDPTKLNIYLPWASYNSEYHMDTDNTTVYDEKKHRAWAESVREYHPTQGNVKQSVFKLHARNYGIVHDCDVVIAYPPSMKKIGGTGQGIRVAKGLGKKLFILCNEADRTKLNEFMDANIRVHKPDFNITVAGTQKFHDYELFAEKCSNILLTLSKTRKIVMHAKCGEHITHMMERFAEEHGFTVRKTAHTKPHGMIVFHDGKSKIVQKQIDIAQKKGMQLRVIKYEDYMVFP